jgi:hypothetical protein
VLVQFILDSQLSYSPSFLPPVLLPAPCSSLFSLSLSPASSLNLNLCPSITPSIPAAAFATEFVLGPANDSNIGSNLPRHVSRETGRGRDRAYSVQSPSTVPTTTPFLQNFQVGTQSNPNVSSHCGPESPVSLPSHPHPRTNGRRETHELLIRFAVEPREQHPRLRIRPLPSLTPSVPRSVHENK